MKFLIVILLNCFLCKFCLADAALDDALFAAIGKKDLESVNKLIRDGANVNATNAPQYSWTPLQRAAELGLTQFVDLLIAKGAQVNIVVGGRTPLHQAAYESCAETVKLLLSKGANPNIKGENGETPLHWAANHSNNELNPARPSGFWPPLSYSTVSNTVESLIAGGAKLKEVKEVLEPPKPRTQKEAIEESFANFADRNMTGAEIVRRKKAENAEKFKDNPSELERQNLLVDQWARDHLDLM